MPEIVIVDEIGTEAEALACRTIAERGVQVCGAGGWWADVRGSDGLRNGRASRFASPLISALSAPNL